MSRKTVETLIGIQDGNILITKEALTRLEAATLDLIVSDLAATVTSEKKRKYTKRAVNEAEWNRKLPKQPELKDFKHPTTEA